MAWTVSAAFAQLKSNLEITQLQTTTVSTRQQEVRSAVEARLTVLDTFLVGSYARSTMISPLADADLDIFAVLDASYYSSHTPASLLDRLRTTLLERYPKTPSISRNGQAVTITFSDFRVDVVPAFYSQGGAFLIPDSTKGTWIHTDPRKHNDYLTAENTAHGGDLVPLVKMIKGWNRSINSAFHGFYLELLTIGAVQGITISDFPSGARFVLGKGVEKVRYLMPDPAGLGAEVGGLASVADVSEAVSKFATARDRALQAEYYTSRNDQASAIAEWKKVFGDYFPSFG